MNAPSLLVALRERGARVSVRTKEGGQTVLHVAPRGVAGDLAEEVVRFKPLLVELVRAELQGEPEPETPLEFLRMLRNSGVSVQVQEVEGVPTLVSEFPEEANLEWERVCAARLSRDAQPIAARIRWERWHWGACARYFTSNGKRVDTAPIGLPYRDWEQFARFQTGAQNADDLRDLARFILELRQKIRGGGAVFHYGHIKIVWRVVAALSDREPSVSDLVRWAEMVAGGDAP